jgi:hypothetical protein
LVRIELTSTKGQASNTNTIQATSGNIEAPGGYVFIDLGPGKPCSDVDRPRVFMNDNFLESGHGYGYPFGRRKAGVGRMSAALNWKGHASLADLLELKWLAQKVSEKQ